jgi:hypothetical protein
MMGRRLLPILFGRAAATHSNHAAALLRSCQGFARGRNFPAGRYVTRGALHIIHQSLLRVGEITRRRGGDGGVGCICRRGAPSLNCHATRLRIGLVLRGVYGRTRARCRIWATGAGPEVIEPGSRLLQEVAKKVAARRRRKAMDRQEAERDCERTRPQRRNSAWQSYRGS